MSLMLNLQLKAVVLASSQAANDIKDQLADNLLLRTCDLTS